MKKDLSVLNENSLQLLRLNDIILFLPQFKLYLKIDLTSTAKQTISYK